MLSNWESYIVYACDWFVVEMTYFSLYLTFQLESHLHGCDSSTLTWRQSDEPGFESLQRRGSCAETILIKICIGQFGPRVAQSVGRDFKP